MDCFTSSRYCLPYSFTRWHSELCFIFFNYNLFSFMQQPNYEDPLNHDAAAVLRDNPKLFESNVRRAMAGGYVGQTFFPRCMWSNSYLCCLSGKFITWGAVHWIISLLSSAIGMETSSESSKTHLPEGESVCWYNSIPCLRHHIFLVWCESLGDAELGTHLYVLIFVYIWGKTKVPCLLLMPGWHVLVNLFCS